MKAVFSTATIAQTGYRDRGCHFVGLKIKLMMVVPNFVVKSGSTFDLNHGIYKGYYLAHSRERGRLLINALFLFA
jgi:hypothetical protein